MKQTISLLTALAFVLTFNGSVFGQADITATAEVVGEISITNSGNVSFGNIPQDIQSTTPTLDATSNESHSGTSGGTQSVGYVVISGSSNTTVSVINPGPVDLQNTDNYSIAFNPTFCVDDGVNASDGDSNTCTSEETENSDAEITNFSGEGTVWIGGFLDNPRDDGGTSTGSLSQGTYENASVTIDVEYNF